MFGTTASRMVMRGTSMSVKWTLGVTRKLAPNNAAPKPIPPRSVATPARLIRVARAALRATSVFAASAAIVAASSSSRRLAKCASRASMSDMSWVSDLPTLMSIGATPPPRD